MFYLFFCDTQGHSPPEVKLDTVPRELVVKCGQNVCIEIPYKGEYLQFFICLRFF